MVGPQDYEKDILGRLEEIEKLQSKLRNLIPRVANHHFKNVSKYRRHDSCNDSFPVSRRLSTAAISSEKSDHEKNVEMVNDEPVMKTTKLPDIPRDYTKKLKDVLTEPTEKADGHRQSFDSPINSRFLQYFTKIMPTHKLNNTSNFQTIYDELQKFKTHLITNLHENKIYKYHSEAREARSSNNNHQTATANATVQTTESEMFVERSKNRGRTGGRKNRTCLRNHTAGKKRGGIGKLFKRLLGRLNYCFVDGSRVATPDHHLGEKPPRRVEPPILFLNEETETLRILSSAARVSINSDYSLPPDVRERHRYPIHQVYQLIDKFKGHY